MQRNLYEILSVNQNASHDEIKKAYQTLILKLHPDKNTHKNNVDFIEVDEAYKILRDPEKRKQYDAELGQSRFNDKPIVHETLKKDEFDLDEESETYYHDCRCGGVYILPEDFEATTNENIYIACDECSLVIEVEKG